VNQQNDTSSDTKDCTPTPPGPLRRLTPSRPPTAESWSRTHLLVVLHASSDLARPGAAAAVQPPCTAWQA
jgi:hypothetical protein